MNLNANQVIAIIIAVLGVITLSNAQLTDIFGPQLAKYIGSMSGLLGTILSAVLANTTSQKSNVRSVEAMDGVERVLVNEKSNPTLAKIAMSDDSPKVMATAASANAVAAIAQGAKS